MSDEITGMDAYEAEWARRDRQQFDKFASYFTPKLLLRSKATISLADEVRVRTALAELTEPLREGQKVELAGIKFRVIRP